MGSKEVEKYIQFVDDCASWFEGAAPWDMPLWYDPEHTIFKSFMWFFAVKNLGTDIQALNVLEEMFDDVDASCFDGKVSDSKNIKALIESVGRYIGNI